MSGTKIKIAIGADHAGFEYKEILKDFLQDYEVKDFGTYSESSVDYPDFAHPVAEAVENGDFTYGILLCGSANGVAITANKHQHVRAGLCWENEVASLVRKHNNANVLCIPARFVSEELAKEITTTFLATEFEGGRHQNRVEKISC
ncbi:ribose 5-phosphate isomerase B [Pedobacter sp. KBS0701]|uniref:ribose 5-phosphate isomerase B n=1 Tax=unclassified Pedobacter TaxID=2628915 RepID=UPI00110E838A|nr:ribose 5-phosphate isomerase B [Pedobacter sp. KBS0701]QDW26769.1 ribose 5-phosphate isomerase B [Pedobacter sp. KBS0701]